MYVLALSWLHGPVIADSTLCALCLVDLRFANKGVYEKILLDNKGTITPATDEIEKDLYV